MSSMYYNDHHTASANKTWSDFYLLVDVAVKVAEEEEESRERIFHVFPRKPRSSLTKRIYPKLNLNGASSSLLFDLNQIPTDSETEALQTNLQLLSSSSPCFIAADPKTLQNPSSDRPSSLALLLGYNTDESDKMEMKNSPNPNSTKPSSSTTTQSRMTETKDPSNPNSQSSLSSLCLMEKPSRKRRAVQERKRTCGFKKAKLAPFLHTARETPEWLLQVMRDMKGANDAKLIFEKTLFTTDVNPTQNRLSMPFNSLLRSDFLTPVESRIINEDINNNKKIGVGAILVDQRCEKWGVMLKRWEMKKERGKGSWNYNLICGWNDIVKANGLKDGDNISLWSFRCCGLLCFAMEQSRYSLVLALC